MMPSWKRARVCSVQPGNVGRAPAPMTIVAISGAAYVRKPSELRRSTTEASDDDLPPHGPPVNQGLTLVHFSAQLELFLTQITPCTPPAIS